MPETLAAGALATVLSAFWALERDGLADLALLALPAWRGGRARAALGAGLALALGAFLAAFDRAGPLGITSRPKGRSRRSPPVPQPSAGRSRTRSAGPGCSPGFRR